MARLTVDDVFAHAYGICFKTGPPGRVGVETEWFVVDPARPADHLPVGRPGALTEAAGPLPAGSVITFEPGGQLELSSVPCRDLPSCHAAVQADLAYVHDRLRRVGLALSGCGVDPLRPPRYQIETGRYRSMRAYFRARGEPGPLMMCSTASVQVCLDIGADPLQAARRWRLAHALGPVLVAAFADSPLCGGRATGWRSTRQAVWAALDPGRTRPPPGDDPAEAWARYALAARVMVMRDGDGGWIADPGMTFGEWLSGGPRGYPTHEDLTYHLTTLFPPVRPRGWFELRMIDAQPQAYWVVPPAVVTALLDDPIAADLAAEAAEPVAGRWTDAARDALTDPALARAARRCFDIARAALPRLGAGPQLLARVDEFVDRYVARARCPADDLIDRRAVPSPTAEEDTWPLSR